MEEVCKADVILPADDLLVSHGTFLEGFFGVVGFGFFLRVPETPLSQIYAYRIIVCD